MTIRTFIAIRRAVTCAVAGLICAGAFAVVGEAHTGHAAHHSHAAMHAAPVVAVNPQPLPPHYGDAARIGPVVAINPQPLPPSHGGDA